MLNAREDHVEEFYGFTYEEYAKKTGCTWIAIQNDIAYLQEVRANSKVIISSKTIELNDRISKVEILMKSPDERIIHSVLWITVIYFDMKQRKSVVQPPETMAYFEKFLVTLNEKTFDERVLALRKQNRLANH